MKKYYFLISIFCLSSLHAATPRAVLTLRAEPEYFSPNNDGLQDQAFLYPVLQAVSEAKTWRLDVMDRHGRRVTRLNGTGLPALIKWDGFDKKGLVLPDGAYIAQLQVSGSGFNLATRYQLYLDTRSPEVHLNLSTTVLDGSTLESGGIEFIPSVFDSSPIEQWQVQVLDSFGRTLIVMPSTGAFKNMQWNGIDGATGVMSPPGVYKSVLVAWDKAGNESPPVFSDFSINTTVRDILQKNLNRIEVIETPIGLLVQLSIADLFNLKMKKPALTQEGQDLLKEIGILVNAYPGVPVTIEGYSKSKNGAAFDRGRASYYGWNVYSYLVKTAHVKASRLTVKGRGRSALFSRRGVAVPFIRNGVEIFLEGNREW